MEIFSQSHSLEINLQQIYQINDFSVQVESHLGYFNQIQYYQVTLQKKDSDHELDQLGLLRVGSAEGGLKRELELRELLGNHKMVSELLAYQTSTDFLNNNNQADTVSESVLESSPNLELSDNFSAQEFNLNLQETELKLSESINITDSQLKSAHLEAQDSDKKECDDSEIANDQESLIEEETEEDNFLEEEYYQPKPLISEGEKLLVLTEIPTPAETLNTWLENNQSLRESLLLVSQITQFFRLVTEQKWCFVSLFPQFIKQSQQGNPIQFFDLTTVYPLGEKLEIGLSGDYYPPEISAGEEIKEQMSTYVVGTLLYQALHHKLPPRHDHQLIDLERDLDLEIKKIPLIYQILNITLTPISQNRFPLSQLLTLLISTRKYFETQTVRWEVSSRSTVGLSTNRLQNEDNYGILQPCASNEPSFILGVVADGMGGMAKGEVASKTAVETILNTSIPSNLNTPEKCNQWLTSLVSEANKAVCEQVRNGGTTLSVVIAIARKLYIAQVGDSRIFLLRNGTICQLSEDHSVVAMLLATAQITYQESHNHPDKSTLTKSLGSNPILPPNYVQNLSRFGGKSWLNLEDRDIVLICSDGVWDLVSAQQLAKNFTNQENLHLAVTETIQQVIEKDAHDNATLIALKCHLENNLF